MSTETAKAREMSKLVCQKTRKHIRHPCMLFGDVIDKVKVAFTFQVLLRNLTKLNEDLFRL